MRPVNRQLRADPSVKNYVWSWEPLPLVRTARAYTAQKVIKVELQSCRGSFFFLKTKRVWACTRICETNSLSLWEILGNVSWFVWWILVIYKPYFRPVQYVRQGKEYLKNLREYLLSEKEHSLTLIAHSFEPYNTLFLFLDIVDEVEVEWRYGCGRFGSWLKLFWVHTATALIDWEGRAHKPTCTWCIGQVYFSGCQRSESSILFVMNRSSMHGRAMLVDDATRLHATRLLCNSAMKGFFLLVLHNGWRYVGCFPFRCRDCFRWSYVCRFPFRCCGCFWWFTPSVSNILIWPMLLSNRSTLILVCHLRAVPFLSWDRVHNESTIVHAAHACPSYVRAACISHTLDWHRWQVALERVLVFFWKSAVAISCKFFIIVCPLPLFFSFQCYALQVGTELISARQSRVTDNQAKVWPQLFLALTDVTVVALTDASVKVVLYKRCTFCPVFFALSTTEEASHSWGETFGRSEASKAGVWETIGRIMTRPESLKNYTSLSATDILDYKLFLPRVTRAAVDLVVHSA